MSGSDVRNCISIRAAEKYIIRFLERKQYGLTVSIKKTNTVAIRGRGAITSKIGINNKIIRQINTYNYLGCVLSYEEGKEVPDTLSRFLQITGNF
jgi:hypothetical protein